jgi:hypothetical protein
MSRGSIAPHIDWRPELAAVLEIVPASSALHCATRPEILLDGRSYSGGSLRLRIGLWSIELIVAQPNVTN